MSEGSADGTLICSAFLFAAEKGDADLHDRFMMALSKSKSTDAYYHFLYGLPDFRQPQLLERSIAFVDQGKVRK